MKKSIFVILLIAGIVFAASGADVTSGSADFAVTTTIEQFVGVKVLNSGTTISAPAGKPWYDAFSSINNSPVTVAASGATFVEVASVVYYANTPFELTVDLPHLSGTNGNPYTIGYSSKIIGDDFSSGSTGETVVKVTSLGANGAQANGGTITMNLNEGDYDSAPADTYAATIKFYIDAL